LSPARTHSCFPSDGAGDSLALGSSTGVGVSAGWGPRPPDRDKQQSAENSRLRTPVRARKTAVPLLDTVKTKEPLVLWTGTSPEFRSRSFGSARTRHANVNPRRGSMPEHPSERVVRRRGGCSTKHLPVITTPSSLPASRAESARRTPDREGKTPKPFGS
jgi:hypothetical protein